MRRPWDRIRQWFPRYYCVNGHKYLDELARPKHPQPPTRKDAFIAVSTHMGARFDLDARNVNRPPESLNRINQDY
jgi:hypothetical protein